MFCFVNLSQLEPQDVHCEGCVQVYSILLHISSLLSTISFLFTAHTVLTKSTPLMAIYRLFLLNCLGWGYLYSLLNGQMQFVLLSPIMAHYMRGQLLPKIFHSIGLNDHHLFVLGEMLFSNYIVGLLLLLLYRFVYFGPNSNSSWCGRLLNSPMSLCLIMLANTLFAGTTIGLILQRLQEVPVASIGSSFLLPRLKSLFLEHNAMISLGAMTDFKLFVLSSFLLALSFFFGLYFFNIWLHKKRSHNVRKLFSNNNNAQTLRIMTQLYRMNTVQIILLGFLLTGPFIIGTILVAYSCLYSHHFWLLAICLSSLHCSFDSLVILLFIRPYRDHLRSILRRMCQYWRKNSSPNSAMISNDIQLVASTQSAKFNRNAIADRQLRNSTIVDANGGGDRRPKNGCLIVEKPRRPTIQ